MTNNNKAEFRDIFIYPILNSIVIGLVLGGVYLIELLAEWSYSNGLWLLGAPLRLIVFGITLFTAIVICTVFIEWINIIINVLGQIINVLSQSRKQPTLSSLIDDTSDIIYETISIEVNKNTDNYRENPQLSVYEKHLVEQLLITYVAALSFNKNSRMQNIGTTLVSWTLHTAESEGQLDRLENPETAFNFIKQQAINIITKSTTNGNLIQTLTFQIARLTNEVDPIRLMTKQNYNLEQLFETKKMIEALASKKHVVDDFNLSS